MCLHSISLFSKLFPPCFLTSHSHFLLIYFYCSFFLISLFPIGSYFWISSLIFLENILNILFIKRYVRVIAYLRMLYFHILSRFRILTWKSCSLGALNCHIHRLLIRFPMPVLFSFLCRCIIFLSNSELSKMFNSVLCLCLDIII